MQYAVVSLISTLPLPQETVQKPDEYAVYGNIHEIPKGEYKEIGGDEFKIMAHGNASFRGEQIRIFIKETGEYAETPADLALMPQADKADKEAYDLTR